MLKKLLATFLSCALMLTIVPMNAFAMENQCGVNPVKKYEDLRVVESKELKIEATKKFEELFIKENIEYAKEDFDFQNLKVAEMNGEFFATVSKSDSILSTITISLDQDKNMYVENYLYEKNGNFWIKTKYNGENLSDVDSEIRYTSNKELIKGIEEIREYAIESQNRGLNVPCFVAVSGAGATVSGLIAKVCGTPCTLAPPACIVCLGGIIVIGGGSIAVAVWKCWE
ncbi:hypothetical protein [uncultured Anaerococcus sp.]|uniref:hypothetical protein n=1 Tax=uncultured Anaerococcus sp. TaxID=293428 RepID=UPI002636E3C0|nr:hypothetical protein [uncultured Anaerococcus sp.]